MLFRSPEKDQINPPMPLAPLVALCPIVAQASPCIQGKEWSGPRFALMALPRPNVNDRIRRNRSPLMVRDLVAAANQGSPHLNLTMAQTSGTCTPGGARATSATLSLHREGNTAPGGPQEDTVTTTAPQPWTGPCRPRRDGVALGQQFQREAGLDVIAPADATPPGQAVVDSTRRL